MPAGRNAAAGADRSGERTNVRGMTEAVPEGGAKRVIAHLDVDAFYASVELLRHPELAGKPVVVSGTGPRAVVTTASYEARKFGIDSAMSAARARRLCPHAVFIRPDFDAYREKSRTLWELVRSRVDRVQSMGLDEAYVDLTGVPKPMRVLREIVADARAATGLVVSVGVGPSRLVAKTVSAAFKPEAFVAMSREDAARHFAAAPTRVLQGVGPKTEERLLALGLETVGQIQTAADDTLAQHFGERHARELKARSFFHDDSPVVTSRIAKSQSTETTFDVDVQDHAALETSLLELAEKLCTGLQQKDKRGRTIGIKLRLDDWTNITRARTIGEFTNDTQVVTGIALELFRANAPARPVRLLGVRVAGFSDVLEEEAAVERRIEQLVLPLEEAQAA
jgi:DNA polymerase-4